jgi:hypothetical protein
MHSPSSSAITYIRKSAASHSSRWNQVKRPERDCSLPLRQRESPPKKTEDSPEIVRNANSRARSANHCAAIAPPNCLGSHLATSSPVNARHDSASSRRSWLALLADTLNLRAVSSVRLPRARCSPARWPTRWAARRRSSERPCYSWYPRWRQAGPAVSWSSASIASREAWPLAQFRAWRRSISQKWPPRGSADDLSPSINLPSCWASRRPATPIISRWPLARGPGRGSASSVS